MPRPYYLVVCLFLQLALFTSSSIYAANAAPSVASILNKVDTLREQGRNRAALLMLNELQQRQEPTGSVQTAISLAGVLSGLGRYEEALSALNTINADADKLNPAERAAYLLERGNITVETGTPSDAATLYRESASYADQANRPILAARALTNALRAQLAEKNIEQLESRLTKLSRRITALGDGGNVAALWVSVGELGRLAVEEFDFPARWRGHALLAFKNAQNATNEPAPLGWAAGFMGVLYENEGRFEEALSLTRKAVFYAQQAEMDEQLYRWEWQLGRLYRNQGELLLSQEAYARAIAILRGAKANITLGSRLAFQRLVAPVYNEYAEVLLTRSVSFPEGATRQQMLRSVRDQLETLKLAEVEDYFANECVVQEHLGSYTQNLGEEIAIIYPVFLDERIELLVEVGDTLAQFSTPVGRNRATRFIRKFRLNLERPRAGKAYLEQAKVLYDWLLRPAEAFLEARRIKTLVVVPAGALRTIPLAALHDGKEFVVERYAIATTPAIKLTQSVSSESADNLLIGGLTEAVQGYSSLPAVEQEIALVAAMYTAKTMQDQSFLLDSVANDLGTAEYSVAHFATHGEFNRDYRKSFILTYDGKLTLNRLQQALRQRGDVPLDLLVLSACQTAAGDDRAALGLAGVAVQSGAKSVLASLWSISDAATTELVKEFYENLLAGETTKANSLREAQLALLKSDRFEHPSFWAPYLLIGSWK